MNPKVSIIIVSYQSRALVRECIKSIRTAIPKGVLDYEVIVVDGERDHQLKTLLETRFPEVAYLPMPRNMGLAVANNAGARFARGEYLVFLNPDITMRAGALERLCVELDTAHDVGMAAPQLLNPDTSIQQSYFRFYTPFTILCRRTRIGLTRWGKKHLAHVLMHDFTPRESRDIEWCIAACFAMKREVWERLGGMDERFFLYFEDMDLARRLHDLGYRIRYVADARITHLYGHSSAGPMSIKTLLNPLTRIHIGSGIRYFLKHSPWRHAKPLATR